MEPQFTGVEYDTAPEQYWGSAAAGYYLSDHYFTNLKVWYRGVKPCTNAPEHARYTGAGTPDAPDGSIIDANDCPWECDAGYYLNNGECKPCTGATYSDTPGATACTQCPTATALAGRVTSYGYWTENGIHYRRTGCRAYITEDDPRGDYIVSCSVCDDDYGVYNCNAAQCQAEVPTGCIGGYYWGAVSTTNNPHRVVWAPTVAAMKDVACIPVGAGYWSADGDVERTPCNNAPENATYVGGGASSDNCPWECKNGYTLRDGACVAMCTAGITHIRTNSISVPLYAAPQTSPSLNIKYAGQVCYGALASGAANGAINIKFGDAVYHTTQ